ncbi:CYTH domain-containing protein [Bacillus sp. DJP31]|uniref:CYTH domain-containing protein n=1 Tax=Bacillus sp. DJP31 TaxID=3409789 RepID=UPI003BB58BAD
MNQEIEIEFKNLLVKEEFQFLLNEYSLTENRFTLQQNHYFDTATFDLKSNGAALRIRHKNGVYTLTLKQPIEEGILETHQVLTEQQAMGMLSGGTLLDGDIQNIIKALQIDSAKIVHFGTLETNRAEIHDLDGILVFDHSRYLNQDDYELEYEVQDFKHGQEKFLAFLHKHGIPIRTTENKIKRFFNAKLSSKEVEKI